MPEKLEIQLDEANLRLAEADARLKKVERWVQVITGIATAVAIVTTIMTIKVSNLQGKLFELQTSEAKEKQRVSYTFRLEASLLPDGRHFYVHSKMSNLSTREISLLMIGIRVWPADKWNDAISVADKPNDVILADNLVTDCPKELCKPGTDTGKLRLRNLSNNLTLEATEKDVQQVYGPYPITKEQLEQGFWLEGWAYVSETDHGDCVVHTEIAPKPGAIPYLCEKNINGQANCTDNSKCSNVASPPTFFTKTILMKSAVSATTEATQRH